jgi:hypothetical protein
MIAVDDTKLPLTMSAPPNRHCALPDVPKFTPETVNRNTPRDPTLGLIDVTLGVAVYVNFIPELLYCFPSMLTSNATVLSKFVSAGLTHRSNVLLNTDAF